MSNSQNIRSVVAATVVATFLAGCGADDGAGPGFVQTNLVSNTAGRGAITDANLVNSWGMASGPLGPWVVANRGSGTATVYDGDGMPDPPDTGTVIVVPPAAASEPGTSGTPTGVVSNATSGFLVTGSAGTAPAELIFATADGTLAGWSSAADPATAITVVDNSADEAMYTGLAIGATPVAGGVLYAVNFRAATVEVYDDEFQPVVLEDGFVDPRLPAQFGPYGIHNIAGNLYVTYARRNRQGTDVVSGGGNGFVSVFDTGGTFVRRFTSQGELNAPWGLAVAPASFGRFGGAILIANTGNGQVNAFDPVSGRFLGQLQVRSGAALSINGLRSIGFGNGGSAGSVDTLYFTAGPGGGSEGLFGTIVPG